MRRHTPERESVFRDFMRREALVAGLAWAIVTAIALFLWRRSVWWISGDDAYYHIRIAAEMVAKRTLYFDTLDWTRLSVFAEGWGDKEYLFHVFLMPFAVGDPFIGAKLALSVLNGVIAGLLGYLGVRHAGRAGWLVPLLAMAATAGFAVRMEQLRPHNISLILLLLLAAVAASRRKTWLVILSCVYALSYTAWQLPVILCALTFATFLVLHRERRWELLWAPPLGIGVGILLHPGFPDNVRIWWLQNVEFFAASDLSSAGTEILGRGIAGLLLENWRLVGLIVLGAILVWPWRPRHRASDHEITFGIFAAATTALYLSAQRFAEYAVPFLALYVTVLAVRFYHQTRTRRLAQWGLTAVMVFGAWLSLRTTVQVVTFNHARYGFGSIGEMIEFRNALPPGARVAATWDFTSFYYFVAPQASYLNVLDPLFMAQGRPEEYAELERMFSGGTPDVASVLRTLGSEYIAYHRGIFPELAALIESDPRMIPVLESPRHNVARIGDARIR